MFDKGDRVMTPLGPGAVAYRRMAPPTYSEVEVYSVCLDSKKAESEKPPFPSYTGTIFKADQVKEEKTYIGYSCTHCGGGHLGIHCIGEDY